MQIDLLRLRQRRTLTLAGSIGPDSELWAGSGLKFSDVVEVRGTVALAAGGGVVVQGSWRASLVYECGRCLDDLQVVVERSLTLLFMPDGSWEAPDPDVRIIDDRKTVLDLQDAIREEVVLEAPRYYTAGEEDGRCTRCGSPVQEYRREPRGSGTDPRWAALRTLQTDQEEDNGGSQETSFQAAEAETPHSR